MKPVQLTIEQRPISSGTLLLALSGRLMLGPEGQALEQAVQDGIAKGDRRFIFDMAGITHIDSTGIGRCISSLNRITQEGGKLHMACAAGHVRESFRVTRLDRVFRFFEDVPAALEAMG